MRVETHDAQPKVATAKPPASEPTAAEIEGDLSDVAGGAPRRLSARDAKARHILARDEARRARRKAARAKRKGRKAA